MRKNMYVAAIALVLCFATPVLAQPLQPPDVPEPATIGLLALGAGALAMTLRSRSK